MKINKFKIPLSNTFIMYLLRKFHDLVLTNDAMMYIVNVKYYWIGINKRLIVIKSNKPGVLIGKKGITIDTLNSFLNTELNKQVKIIINNSNLWKG